jgi:NADPH-dependent 2,4-dienoyl-CoA reductase/sulfur reductase-like enzyme
MRDGVSVMGNLTMRNLPADTPPGGLLVAGAGPAGLGLALQAHDHGADVRVIDRGRRLSGRPAP